MELEMEKAVKKDILTVLKKAQRYINRGEPSMLKKLSDQTIHNAGIFQDKDSLSTAVIIYAASKLLDRWGFESEHAEQIRNLMGSAHFCLSEGRLSDYRDEMKKLFELTASVDKEFRIYIDKVLEKAQIKKGSRLHEHGLSVARAADLLGIGQWELMSYVGKTRMHDEFPTETGVEHRLKFTRSLFE
jgi:hypothetical protein